MKGGCQCEHCQTVRRWLTTLERYYRASLGVYRNQPPIPDDHREDYLDGLGAVEAILEKDRENA